MTKKSGLGRGLGSLIPTGKKIETPTVTSTGVRVSELAPGKISVNPDQPRSHFDKTSLEELTQSIKEHGILQPLVVMEEDGGYVLISGERRLRAAKTLRLPKVPVVLRSASEIERLELALIENIQRQDLNPVELAESYMRLIDEFGATHEQLAKRLGKKRASITNILRLLKLPGKVQQAVASGEISLGHAKILAGMENEKEQLAMMDQILQGDLSVRRTETEVGGQKNVNRNFKKREILDPNDRAKKEQLESKLGTDVSIQEKGGKGRITIHYYSPEELHEIVKRICS